MSGRLVAILSGALAGMSLGTAAAEDLPGEVALGRALAVKSCERCHHIEAGDREGNLPDPPAFQNLADDPAMTPLALRVFLTTPHTDMPNLILTDAEVDDIVAYIHSLKSE